MLALAFCWVPDAVALFPPVSPSIMPRSVYLCFLPAAVVVPEKLLLALPPPVVVAFASLSSAMTSLLEAISLGCCRALRFYVYRLFEVLCGACRPSVCD